MRRIITLIKKHYIYASPFLVALYTVLFLYSKNEPEYRVQVLMVPVLMVLIFAVLVFVLFQTVLKMAAKTAIISSIFIFIALSYGRFLSAENNVSLSLLGLKVPTYAVALSAFVVILIALFVFLFKTKKNLIPINKMLVVVSLVLLIFPIYQIVSYEAKTGRILRDAPKAKKLDIKPVSYKGEKPDIYYIILDRYDGQRSLTEQLNFDNSKFLNFLKDKGFYVPSNSTTNYPKTFESFGSSLNMEYINYLTEQTGGGASSDESVVTPLIRNNKLVEYLKNRGYTYIQVGSWWQPTTINPNADVSYYPLKKGYPYVDEFTTGFLNTTITAPLFKVIFHDPTDVSVDPQNNIHRSAALYQFKTFEKIPSLAGPKFVFAHILLPHDPFVFDKNCTPISEDVTSKKQHQENYLAQIQCANIKTEEMIENILSKSKTKPVIVLQADEGIFPMNSPLPPKQGWGSATDQALREKFSILNSYYFPGKDTSALYDTITPVNSFRVVLNTYFKEKLPLLEDRNYVFQDQENYYKFIDVTSKVKN